MRLHPRLLVTRYGMFTIMPMFLFVFFGSAFRPALIAVTAMEGS